MAKSDIEIAREATLKPITEIAQKLDIPPESFKPFGHDKAKLTSEFINSLNGNKDGKLILVTAISPTPAGEGKTTTTVGLGDGLNSIGKKAVMCLARAEPRSLLRYEGWRCRWWLCPGRADGRYQPAFYR